MFPAMSSTAPASISRSLTVTFPVKKGVVYPGGMITLSADEGTFDGLQLDAVVHDDVAPFQVNIYPLKDQLELPVLSALLYAVIIFAGVRLLLS